MEQTVGAALVELTLKNDKLKAGLADTDSAMRKSLGGLADMAKRYLAPIGAAFGVRELVRSATEAELISSRLDAVLRATGNTASVSRSQIDGYADAILRTTRFSDEAARQASTVLLTMPEIGGAGFGRTLTAAADLAEIMGGDLPSAAAQLGRALVEPAEGMMFLRRAGIVFTDSQKDMIKKLQESGKLIDAQAALLKLVEDRTRGAAAAVGASPAGQVAIAKNQLEELAETTGKPLLVGLGAMGGVLNDILGGVQSRVEDIAYRLQGVSRFERMDIEIMNEAQERSARLRADERAAERRFDERFRNERLTAEKQHQAMLEARIKLLLAAKPDWQEREGREAPVLASAEDLNRATALAEAERTRGAAARDRLETEIKLQDRLNEAQDLELKGDMTAAAALRTAANLSARERQAAIAERERDAGLDREARQREGAATGRRQIADLLAESAIESARLRGENGAADQLEVDQWLKRRLDALAEYTDRRQAEGGMTQGERDGLAQLEQGYRDIATMKRIDSDLNDLFKNIGGEPAGESGFRRASMRELTLGAQGKLPGGAGEENRQQRLLKASERTAVAAENTNSILSRGLRTVYS